MTPPVSEPSSLSCSRILTLIREEQAEMERATAASRKGKRSSVLKGVDQSALSAAADTTSATEEEQTRYRGGLVSIQRMAVVMRPSGLIGYSRTPEQVAKYERERVVCSSKQR